MSAIAPSPKVNEVKESDSLLPRSVNASVLGISNIGDSMAEVTFNCVIAPVYYLELLYFSIEFSIYHHPFRMPNARG